MGTNSPEYLREYNLRNRDRLNRSHISWKLNHPANYLLQKAKTRARLKGWECDLTRDWIEERLAKGCEVTNLPFRYETGSAKLTNPWSPSIDRIKSTEGYTKTNCRIVVWMYNVAKSAWKDEDVMIMVEAIANRKNI